MVERVIGIVSEDFDFWTGFAADASERQGTRVGRHVMSVAFGQPLDAQFGAWPTLNVPPDLEPVLFPQDGRDTFAILDAGALAGLPEILEESELEFKCLYTGELADELRDYAPYLVKLSADNRLTRALFTLGDGNMEWWGEDYGMFILASSNLEELWQQLRKFTYVKSETTGKPVYLRFWSSAALSAMMRFAGPDPLIDGLLARNSVLFRSLSDPDPAKVFVMQGQVAQ